MSAVIALETGERAELDSLNAAVDAALRARRNWLDAKMAERSPLKVGDLLYELETGQRLGRIVTLYRIHRNAHEGVYDTSPSFDYIFEAASSNCYDNTSRQPGSSFGSREEAILRMEQRLRALGSCAQG